MADLVELLEAIDKVWKAHEIATVNGGGAWKRHVEPAIYNLQAKAREFKASLADALEEKDSGPATKKMYGAGHYDKEKNELHLFDGPNPILDDMLNHVAPFNEERLPAYIVEFGKDGEWDAVYRWDSGKGNWLKCPDK